MKYCTFGLVPSTICISCEKNINNHHFENERIEWQLPPVKDDECIEHIPKSIVNENDS